MHAHAAAAGGLSLKWLRQVLCKLFRRDQHDFSVRLSHVKSFYRVIGNAVREDLIVGLQFLDRILYGTRSLIQKSQREEETRSGLTDIIANRLQHSILCRARREIDTSVYASQTQVIPVSGRCLAETSDVVMGLVVVECLQTNLYRTLAAQDDRVVVLHVEAAPRVIR